MPASAIRAQNGSYTRSPGERNPVGACTGPARITMTFAPCSSTQSSSRTAASGSSSVKYGAPKMRPW